MMNSTGKRIIQRILAILVILTMTMADFCVAGINLVSYASSLVEINNKNVGFDVYFANSNKALEREAAIDSNDLKLAIELSVKSDGYLAGGKIALDDNANFKFKNEINNSHINKIEDKTIYLNQINEGDKITLEVGIEFQDVEEMTSDYLSKLSTIRLSGTYINSKNVEKNVPIEINGKADLKVTWKAPEKLKSELNVNVLTNSVYKVDEVEKRIIQLLVTSKLIDNLYPVKNTNIELNIPIPTSNGEEQKDLVESVTVAKRSTAATNGDREFNYEYKDGKLVITAQNGLDEKISWLKNANDSFVVTIQYPSSVYVPTEGTVSIPEGTRIGKVVEVNSNITTYDNQAISQKAEVLLNQAKDEIVSISNSEKDTSIGKGKLYTGEDKNYTTTSKIYVNYSKPVDSITVNENQPVFVQENEEKQSGITYVQTILNKNEITSILGENGTIDIEDQSGKQIITINKNTEVDENGNIVVKYGKSVTGLKINISKPQKDGKITLEHTKKISKTGFSRDEIKKLTKIKDSSELTYVKNDTNAVTKKTSSQVALKETESKASLSVSPTTISTESNQELNMKVVLETNNENRDLYKNPVLKIKLPKQINSVKAEAQLLYGNGLKIEEFKVNEENGQEVITVKLKGEQKTYEGEAVEGATLLIKAEVGLDKLSTNSEEEIVLNYTNENATIYADKGEEKVKVNIVSESSMILTNDIEEYGIRTYGKEESKEVYLGNKEEAKTATVKMQIINNEEAEITNVAVIGKIANIDKKVERTSEVRANKEATIYYTNVENPTTYLSEEKNKWTQENIKDAKYYLVVIKSIKAGDKVTLSYNMSVAKDLGYNQETETGYKVGYTNALTGKQKEAKATTLKLTTGKVAEIKLGLEAEVAGEKINTGDEVKAGEIITYTAKITNTGKEKAENVIFTATVPDNTTLIEVNKAYVTEQGENESEVEESEKELPEYFIVKTEKEVKQENIKVDAGKTVEYTYMVRVNPELSEEKTGETKISVKYNDKEVQSATLSNKFSKANLIATLIPLERMGNEELKSGNGYIYKLNVYNPTGEEQKNVQVSINKNDLINITSIDYLSGEQYVQVNNETLTFTIGSIAAKDTAYVEIDTLIGQIKDDLKTADISAIVKDSIGTTYRSNELSEKVAGPKTEITLNAKASTASGYVKPGEEIEYTIKVKNTGNSNVESLEIQDRFSDYLDLQTVTLNGKEYEVTNTQETGENITYNTLAINSSLDAGKEATIEIKGKVNEDISSTEVLKVVNKAMTYSNNVLLSESDEKIHYIEPITGTENDDILDEENGNNNGENNNQEDEKKDEVYITSGTVWFDQNQNGSRDSGEELLSGVKVYAIDVTTNKIATDSNGTEISATTDEQGTYTLMNIKKGKYIIAFEYNTGKYITTIYQADGVNSDRNSDAVRETREVNGETKTLAVTDSIDLSTSLANIDLGLAEAKVFDLTIEKVISKMIVTNSSGTKTYEFDNTNLAKVEIAGKNLKDSNVVVEYKIRVTNNGELAGYAKSIVDYMPSSLAFNSSLNSDWYQKDGKLYTSSLADTIIEPGETKEVTLTLTKKMTESNTGLTNNKAEIETTYNSLGVENASKAESTSQTGGTNNKVGVGSADMIVGVKTGTAVSYVALTLSVLIVIAGAAYLVNKKILMEKIKI